MDLPTLDILIGLALIISIAYTVYGLTGFGSTVTGLPFLLIFIPLHIAAPMMQVYDLIAGSIVGIRNRRSADLRELWHLAPFLLIGLALGTTILIQVPEKYLLLVLGVFLVCYSSWSLFFQPASTPIAAGWAALFGTVGGIFTAIFGTGGPIYTVFLTRRIQDKEVLRATASLMIFIAGATRLLLLLVTGYFSRDHNTLQLALFLLPFLFLGIFVGSYLHRRFSSQHFMKAIWLILIVAGVNVFRQGLAR